jgi:hypothetical protein
MRYTLTYINCLHKLALLQRLISILTSCKVAVILSRYKSKSNSPDKSVRRPPSNAEFNRNPFNNFRLMGGYYRLYEVRPFTSCKTWKKLNSSLKIKPFAQSASQLITSHKVRFEGKRQGR